MHVIKCASCQKHANMQLTPTSELHIMISPYREIDLVYVINPKLRKGHNFIITSIK